MRFEGIPELRETVTTEHFVIRFSHRDPLPGSGGRGVGTRGIHRGPLLTWYSDALETSYAKLEATRHESKPKARTEVYVYDISGPFGIGEPFATVAENDHPRICLSSRKSEPALQQYLHMAAVEAAHEVTHVFNWAARPPLRGLTERKWRWFDEATAVLMETLIYPGNLDSTRFCLNWMDLPELPVDHPGMRYEAGMFARYLARRFGPQLISDIWTKSESHEDPISALHRLTSDQCPEHLRDMTPENSRCWIFGEYAHDSYFLVDYRLPAFAHDAALRFGYRAITESFRVSAGGKVATMDRVAHLACRYYRIEVASNVKEFKVAVQLANAESVNCLECQLGVLLPDQTRGASIRLSHGAASTGGSLTGALTREHFARAESIILTVANCGTRDERLTPQGDPHDDGREYTIKIAASG